MYKFTSRNEAEVTCRRWILDPNGCVDNRCPYFHGTSKYLSPPCAYACYAFNNGGCPNPQNECLYAHLVVGGDLKSANLSTLYPYLSSQDLRIAQAAADGGFDCSNWPKLRDLLIATKAAVQPTSGKSKPRYPDRYNGPAAFQSSIYPDYWRPDAVRPRKGVVESYRDAARTPSVPAFAKPAHQILGELSQATGGKRAGSPATVVGDSVLGFAKNSNRIPLRPRSNNTKRPTGYFVDVVGSDPKRVKTETSSQRSFGNENAPISADIIDLTQDQPTHIKTSSSQLPSRAPSTRPGPQVRPVPRARSGNHRNKAPRKRQVPQNVIRDDTSSILARCASKLRAAAHSMDMDRESLRERWEIDADLKLQSVTDDLGDLNAKFHECQETMVQATRIVEEKLLHR